MTTCTSRSCPVVDLSDHYSDKEFFIELVLYSVGTDGLLKAASTSTGQVTSKIIMPPEP